MALANVRGLLRTIIVRARAADVPTTLIPTFVEVAEIAGQVSRYWKDVSRGALELAIHVYPSEVDLAQSAAELLSMERGSLADAIKRAALPDIDIAQADLWIGFVNTICGGGNVGNAVISGASQELGQRGWRWCARCHSLAVFDPTAKPGPCRAGGTHDHSTSLGYVARI